ncbi:hypothetical protein BT69DRAFT_1295465 [Atractiella rhizophila]|nr:hypothetical protein BT69DRAFT_1295465 [Atractiella rhizophila]
MRIRSGSTRAAQGRMRCLSSSSRLPPPLTYPDKIAGVPGQIGSENDRRIRGAGEEDHLVDAGVVGAKGLLRGEDLFELLAYLRRRGGGGEGSSDTSNPVPPLCSASFHYENGARNVSIDPSFAFAICLCHFSTRPTWRHIGKGLSSSFANAIVRSVDEQDSGKEEKEKRMGRGVGVERESWWRGRGNEGGG